MKYSILKLYCLLAVLIIGTSFKHPIKLTASLIEYDDAKKTLHIETKVFIDDFITSLKKSKGITLNIDNVNKENEQIINDYFNENLKISFNQKELILKYNDLELMKQYNVVVFKWDFKAITLKKGLSVEISNTLFFTDFGYIQSNRCTLRIPPFIQEENYDFNLNEYSIKKTI